MRAVAVLVPVLAVSSGCAYKAGSFSHPRQDFIGQRVTVGCVDIAVERRPDLPTGGTVLGYAFGNRCDRAVTIDLAQARVQARTFSGVSVTLTPYDPRGEIRAMLLDGRAAGGEAIAYQPPADAPADVAADVEAGRFAEVCVDAASVAHAAEPTWLCFASRLIPDTLAEAAP